MAQSPISIVVPVRNEKENLEVFFLRLHQTLTRRYVPYEAIVIDDHSDDGSWELINQLKRTYPLRAFRKLGKIGKGYSIMEGVRKARFTTLAFIDADLAYPPEALPDMIAKLKHADIVVAERLWVNDQRRLKKILGKVFRFVFGRVLFGINYDVQAGLKVFTKEAIHPLQLHPGTWSLDIEFLLKAVNAGFTVAAHPIKFGARLKGQGKLNPFTAGLELALMAITLKLSPLEPVLLHQGTPTHAQIAFKGKRFTTHTHLPGRHLALQTLTFKQILVLAGLLLLATALFFQNWHLGLILLVSLISVIYFVDLLFYFYLIFVSFKKESVVTVGEQELAAYLKPWPKYSILCPLYQEWQILPQFLQGLKQLDYPRNKLEVLLILEEDDRETRRQVKTMDLPDYIKPLVLPATFPKTKPKACNYALAQATGKYAVIYDAEDIPNPLQLKKAVVAFDRLKGEKVICLQAQLDFYNPKQNLLTRLFTAEYSLWFDLILTGLNTLNAPIPLGGTSNHFKTRDLRLLNGWDPFNVTEDCDLGMRLFKLGYRTAILKSTTMEEANSDVPNWLRQRSRWIKGYIQTYLIHMRRPHEFLTEWGNWHLLTFQLVVGGKTLSILINPLLWAITASYFILRPFVGDFIESLYLGPVYYIAVISLIFGNFMYLYVYMIGCAKRRQWSLVKYALITPFYWLMMSLASWMAFFQIFFKPHFWEKTVHGLHLSKDHQPYQPALKTASL